MEIYVFQPQVLFTEGVDKTVQEERVQCHWKPKGTMSLKSWEENSQSHRWKQKRGDFQEGIINDHDENHEAVQEP